MYMYDIDILSTIIIMYGYIVQMIITQPSTLYKEIQSDK